MHAQFFKLCEAKLQRIHLKIETLQPPTTKDIVCVDDKMANLYDVLYHNPNAKVYLWIDPKTA